jgi:hypothetical protein
MMRIQLSKVDRKELRAERVVYATVISLHETILTIILNTPKTDVLNMEDSH